MNSVDARRAIEMYDGKIVASRRLYVQFSCFRHQIIAKECADKRRSAQGPNKRPTNVYVSCIPHAFPFIEHLHRLGQIKCGNLGALHKGIAFIDFETHEDAQDAIDKLEGMQTNISIHRIRARFASSLPKTQYNYVRFTKGNVPTRDSMIGVEHSEDDFTRYFDVNHVTNEQTKLMLECLHDFERKMAKRD
jgi:RNA recognition motif-containing protein